MRALRVLVAGVAAAVAWGLGIAVVFGPAQSLLADPQRQSAKFLAAFTESPLPRMAEHPALLWIGLAVIGCVHSAVYEGLGRRLPGGPVRRGVTFGLIAWALMVPWFEFYLPWNVMREPLPLVLLEAACWLVVLLGVGLAVAGAHHALAQRSRAEPIT